MSTDAREVGALIFAPPPPPPGGLPGGIAAITAVLMRELGERTDVAFASPVRKEDSGRFGIRRGLQNLVRLRRETLRVRQDGVVLFFSSAGFSFWEKCIWSLLVRLLRRRVAIVMVDGNFPDYFNSLAGPMRALARRMLRGPRVILGAQSPSWQDYFTATFPESRVGSVSAGVDREFYESHARPDGDGTLRLLYVGWIIEAKGILDLLDAVVSVTTATTRRFHLRLVGPVLGDADGWHRELDRRGLGDVVTLAGSVNVRSELLREYRAADIFVFPSHFEGFPVALVEAAAVGLPSIGTRVGGVPDILDGGRAGILVSAHSPSELAGALRLMLEDDAKRLAYGSALREHARREYTHEECASSYLRLMDIDPGTGRRRA